MNRKNDNSYAGGNKSFRYVIVQAGGRGSRMELLTRNKPKALVPVDNRPILFHLFEKYPDKKFIIIGDYQYDVLEKYLAAFAKVDYTLVHVIGHTGTIAGMQDALSLVPSGEPFLLLWCDLILSSDFEIPVSNHDLIGIAEGFSCRWSYRDGEFREIKSDHDGVAGCFFFQFKEKLTKNLPKDGEFVRFLHQQGMKFERMSMSKTKEYGLYREWMRLPRMKCRPFNCVTVKDNRVYKQGIDSQGRQLGKRETAWYQQLQGKNFSNIPEIYGYEPLCMEFIEGHNIYEYSYLPLEQKRVILKKLVDCLSEIHRIGTCPVDKDSFYENYVGKTFDRLERVKNLVPFANEPSFIVNGKRCRNILFWHSQVEYLIGQYMPKKFCFIHGDCTFSNILLRFDIDPVLIDPRGYFGHTEFYGDPAYDWAKLYYSLVGNYDQFNLKRFTLSIPNEGVELDIGSSNWEKLEDEFFRMLSGEVTREQMKFMLALIWLSLTTYAWEDYDSICGAFYQGSYYFEEAMEMFEKQGRLMQSELRLTSLAHTWILDLDGTIVRHNGYKDDGKDTLMPAAKVLLSQIPEKDCIIFLTARTEEFRDITEAFLHQQNIRYDEVIFNVPSGERILLNDDKPSGKCMCRAISFPRNGLPMIQVIEDESL